MNKLKLLQQWLLYTPSGRQALRNERLFYQHSIQNIFGYYSLQFGLEQINFLQGNKISNHYFLGQDVLCEFNLLPFESNSIDLIICPHVLELGTNYLQILEECKRILIPNGKLILTVFNPNGIFNYLNRLSKKVKILCDAEPISVAKLSDQLRDLNFRIEGGKFLGYRPILNNAELLSRLSWLDKVGDRWLPSFANVYGLTVCKEVVTPTPITPQIPQVEYEPQLGSAKICKNTP